MHAYFKHLWYVNKAIFGVCNFREMELIPPIAESMWDIEKYCLTYQKDGTTYELYDEQQILYPSQEHVLCYDLYELFLCKEQTQYGSSPLLLYSSPPCYSNCL